MTEPLLIGPDRHGRRVAVLDGTIAASPPEGARVLACGDGEIGAGAVCAGWVPEWPGTRELFKLGARMFDLKKQILAARAAGITVSAGVANDYYDVRWLDSEGVSGIWTDDVPMAARAIYGG